MTARILAIGFGGAALLLAGLGFAAGPGAEALMAHRVDAALAQPPFTKSSHGALRYSLWRGRLEIDDLALATSLPDLPSLRAAQVTITGAGPRLLLGFSGDSLSLDTVAARKLELQGLRGRDSIGAATLSGIKLAAGPAGAAAAPEVREQSLYHIAIAHLAFHDFRHTGDDEKGGITAASLSADGLADGKVASFTITDAAMVMPVDGSLVERRRVDIGEMRLTGFDGLALLQAAGAASDGEMRPLADTVTIDKLGIAAGDRTLAIGSVTLAGLRAAPGALRHDGTAWHGGAEKIGLDRLEATALAFASPEDGTKASLGHLAIDKLAPGSLDGVALDTLAFASPRGVLHLGDLEAKGLAFSTGDLIARPPHFFLKSLHLADLAAGARPGAEVTVKEATAEMAGSLDRPGAFSLKIASAVVPATAMPQLLAAGYNELALDYEGRSRYDTDQGLVDSTQRLTAQGAGTLTVSLRFSHYAAAPGGETMAAAMQRFLAARLERFELRYDDNSLAERLMKLAAEASHRDVAAVRRSLIATLATERAGLAGKPALAVSLDRAIAFLNRPGTISLMLAPPQPVPLAALLALPHTDLEATFETLGLSLR